MKRYASSAILLAALALTLAAAFCSLWASGRLPPPPETVVSAPETRDAPYRLEGGRLRVNINEAGEETLMLLPGLGDVLSQAVVRDREENGPFASVDELARVPGISAGRVEALRDMICCGGE